MKMTIKEIESLEAQAQHNDGRCSNCTQTIKIYRYPINKTAALFMRALETEIRNSGTNDVDISKIGLAYSVRSQVSKIRQHGLIARVKDEAGVQLPSRWLVTTKGWNFINGKSISSRVIVFNNQVLGHDEAPVTIHGVLGEKFDPKKTIYADTPVSAPEARAYSDIRQPKRHTEVTASYRGQTGIVLETGKIYDLQIDRLALGNPIIVNVENIELKYKDIAAFQRDWKIT